MSSSLCLLLLLGGQVVLGRQGVDGLQKAEVSLNFEEAGVRSAEVLNVGGPGLLPLPATSLWLARTWALALLTFCTLGSLLCLLIFYYVVVKMREGTLVGNQTMGLLLLLSVLLLFLSVPPWLVPPSHTVCALRHSAHLLALALCLGVLLVKVMQLRQMDRVGLGGNISLVNQSVSLAFMVLVQVVIIAEWFLIHRPITAVMVSGQLQCDVSRDTFLLLHVYIYVLLLINVFCSVSVYNIQKNFNEGRWISLASLCLTPIFSLWPVVHYFTPSSFHDPTMAVTIASSAATLLATIFFPKLFTISAQSKLNRQKEQEQMMAYSHSYYPPSSPSCSASSHSSHLPSYQMPNSHHSLGGSQRSLQRKGGLATLYSAPQAPLYPSWPPLQQPPEVSAKFNGLNFLADYYMGDTSLTLTRDNSRRPVLFS